MDTGGFEIQIGEMRRLLKSTSDAAKRESITLAIDGLQKKQQIYLQNKADGTDEMEIDPFQDFTHSPSVTSGNTRPMSSRPMSARRRSVPNLNTVPENKNLKPTNIGGPHAINNSMLSNSMLQVATAASPNTVNRKHRRNSLNGTPNAISITEDIFSPHLLSGTAEKIEMIGSGPSAIVASSQIKGERRERQDSNNISMNIYNSPPSSKHSISGENQMTGNERKRNSIANSNATSNDLTIGLSRSLQSLHSQREPADKYDGYSSSESISSTTSDRAPLCRKRRAKVGILGSLDDVIEEMPVFNISNDVSLLGNLKEINPSCVDNQFSTSGLIDCFGAPLVVDDNMRVKAALVRKKSASGGLQMKNNTSDRGSPEGTPRSKSVRNALTSFTPWITTGLFPQFYCVQLKKIVSVCKVVVVASGICRFHLLIDGVQYYSNTTNASGICDESSIGMTVHSFDVERKVDDDVKDVKGAKDAKELKLVVESAFTGCHFVTVRSLKVLVE